jgi:signal transduction histidine kinase
MKPIETVLLVEDNPGDARLVLETFKEQDTHNTELIHVDCMRAAEKHLAEHVVDIILLDPGLPDALGLEAVQRAHAAAPRTPLVVLTGLDDEAMAVQALKEGAQDYLVKGQLETRALMRALRYASERKRMEWLKDDFVATVSHELRTPLTSISGSLGLLVGHWASTMPDSAARLLAIAHKNSQRLVRLINDILDIEKLEAGLNVFNFSRVDVRALINQTIEANRGFAESYDVRIRLCAGSMEAEVDADPDRLAQVVTNLLSNAIKFSPARSEVVIAVEKSSDVVRVSVRDHGPGVPPDFKQRIFERFAQADSTNSRQRGGTGLGLSIVKQIVERLHGEVGFDDAPGGGTIFYVDLPASDGSASWEVDLEASSSAARVLLCDDDRDTAIAARGRLQLAGFAVDFAFQDTAALERASAIRYAAVVIHLQLPDGDKRALVRGLRALAHYRKTPIIVISADPKQARDDIRSRDLNVSEWLGMPVDLEHLVQILATLIEWEPHRRPCILHVDDDHEVLTAVKEALHTIADVVSVDSVTSAREALLTHRVDLAVLDILLDANSGLELLPDLRDHKGNAIPIIIFSAKSEGLQCDEQINGVLTKSSTSLEDLAATIRHRLAHLPAVTIKEVA